MQDQRKTKKQLIEELNELRAQVSKFQKLENKYKKTRLNLKDNEKRYRTLYDHTPAMIHSIDSGGKIIDVSDHWLEVMGYKKDEVLGKKLINFLAKESRKKEKLNFAELHETGYISDIDYQFIKKNGNVIDVKFSAISEKDHKGKAIRSLAIFENVTESKQSNEALKLSEARYRRLTENAKDMIYRMSLPDGRYEYVSSASSTILGYSPEEFYNAPRLIQDAIHPNWQDYFKKEWAKLISGEMPPFYEYQIIHKNGEIKWLFQRNVLVKDDKGKPIAIEGIVTDITDRKQAEVALRESEERFLNAFHSSPNGISISRLRDGCIIEANDRLTQLIGYSSQEIIGKTSAKLNLWFDPNDRDKFTNMILKEGRISDRAFAFRNKSGERRDCLLSAELIELSGEKCLITAIHDITERKNAEEALREIESFNRAVIERSPMGVSVRSRTGKLLQYNEAWKRIWSKSAEKIKDDMTREQSELNFTETDQYLDEWQEKVRDVYEKGGYLYIPEAAHVNKKDGELWVSQYFYAIKNDQGEVDQVVVLTEDITARKKAEETSQRSHHMLEKAERIANMGSWEWDLASNHVTYSANALELYGIAPEEYDGNFETAFSVFHPEDIGTVKQNIEEMLAEKKPRMFEYRIIKPDGTIRNIEGTNRMYFDDNGKIIRMVGHIQDITKRKLAEEELRRYECIVSSSHDMMALLDKNFIYLAANESYLEPFGLDRSEVIGHTIAEVFGHKFFNKVIIQNAEQCLAGNDVLFETWFDFPVSGKRFMEVSYFPYRGANNEIIGFSVNSRDITDRKQAEEALQDSRSKLLEAQKIARLGHYVLNIATGNWTNSAELDNIFGIEKGFKRDVDGWIKIVHPDYREMMSDYLQNTVIGQRLKFDKEYKIIDLTTRQEKYVHGLGNLKFDKNDNPIEMFGTIHDITERKQTEEKLKEERDKAQKYLDIAGVMFVALNYEGNVALINKKGCQILGYNEHEIIGKNWFDHYLPENMRDMVKPVYDGLMAGEQENVEYYENLVLTKDGLEKLIAWHNTILKDEQGNIIGTLSSGEDITVRKEAEEALRERQEMIRALIETSQDWIWSIDKEGKHTYCNPAVETILGYHPDEMIGKNSLDLMHDEDREKIASKMAEWIKNERGWSNLLIRWKHKDGGWRYLESNSVPIFDSQGEIVGFRGMDRDITDRRQTEEALRDNEEKYRNVISTSSDAIFIINAKSKRFVEVNQACEELYGYSREDFLKLEIYDISAEPDKTDEAIEQALRGELNRIILRYHKNKEGRIFPVEVGAGKFTQADQTLICGFVRDITQRKEHEQKIRESQERFHRLSEASFEGIVISEKGLVLDANNQMAEMLGCDLDELIGENIIEFVAPESKALVLENIRKGFEDSYEHKALKKDGTRFPVEIQAKSMPFDGRTVRVTAVHDLTQKKEVEEALQRSQAVLEESQKMASIGGWSVDLTTKERIWTDEVFRIYEIEKGKIPSTDEALNFYPSEARSILRNAIAKLIESSESYDLELPFITAKGKRLWIRTMGKAIFQDGKIVKVSGTIQDITERKRAEEALKESEEKLRKILDSSPDAITVAELDGKIIDCNPVTGLLHGYTKEELIDKNMMELISQSDRNSLFEQTMSIIEGNPPGKIECILLKKDGSEFPAEFSPSIINDSSGKPQFVMGITRDLTEQKKLESQFLQAQKMESVGRLAGGVAHDFNNLLTAIIGHSELMELVLKPDDPLIEDIKVIQQASDRASDLTRQLLAFSRKQSLKPKIVDLSQVIKSMSNMLKRIIGEDIDFSVQPAEELWKIEVDPGQIEQVIVNLAVNARDAMPDGGKLTITTSNIELEEKLSLVVADIPPGKYVVLSVCDEGSGMTEEIKLKIFEPFFTTKEQGKGTGLGLSTVYGIVRQSNGYIYIQSEPGIGTTFEIYLPTVEGELDTTDAISGLGDIPLGSETILIVEDDESVRRVTVESLRRYGYHVIEAITGGDALLQCEQMDKPVDLVITDVVMPNISGPEFIEKLKELWPEFRKLYISGYTEHSLLDKGRLKPHLQKPFRPKKLVMKVREVLDAKNPENII